MKNASMSIDLQNDIATVFRNVEKLITTSCGHYCMPLLGDANDGIEKEVEKVLAVGHETIAEKDQMRCILNNVGGEFTGNEIKEVRVSVNRIVKQGLEITKQTKKDASTKVIEDKSSWNLGEIDNADTEEEVKEIDKQVQMKELSKRFLTTLESH